MPNDAMPIPRALCWPCITVGLGLCLAALAAAAADTPAPAGLTLGHVVTMMFGLITALVGAYAKGLERRVTNTEQAAANCANSVVALRELVLREYHTNTEIRELIAPVIATQEQHGKVLRALEMQVQAVHNRLDFAGIGPKTRRTAPDDGN